MDILVLDMVEPISPIKNGQIDITILVPKYPKLIYPKLINLFINGDMGSTISVL
jgi:hypothetical protein